MEEDTGFDEIMDKVMKKYIQTKGESIENEVFKANIRLDSYNLKKENTEGINKIKKKKFCWKIKVIMLFFIDLFR